MGEMGMILQSTDYGKTWNQMREEEDVFMNDIVRVDETTLYIAGEFGLIFKSTDNGKTWKDTQTDSPNSFTAVAFRTPQEGVVVGLGGLSSLHKMAVKPGLISNRNIRYD